ncbi:MAG: MBL fold metallo-hydrolase [Spirochaetia bacterium]
MKLFFHFAVVGFSNSYLIGPEGGGDAIIVDPGIFDVPTLKLIEDNNYSVKYVLLTHGHEAHIYGLKTLMKVYNAKIYAASPRIYEFPVNRVADRDMIELAGEKVEVIEVPGHTNDSVVYRIRNLLFTGDVIGAGDTGSTPNAYARALLKNTIQEKLFTLPDNYVILPGHGPPSTIETEKQFNTGLQEG